VPLLYRPAPALDVAWHSKPSLSPPSLPATCLYFGHSTFNLGSIRLLTIPLWSPPLAKGLSLNGQDFPSSLHLLILLILKSPL
jgi:hypothetical protein